MSEDPEPYMTRPAGPPIARQWAISQEKLQAALPLRPEQIPAFVRDLARLAEATGQPVENLTIGDLLSIAPRPEGSAWFAVGKIDGVWHAVSPSGGIIPIIKGRRRRLFEPSDFARAQPFLSEKLARAAGHAAGFSRTYAIRPKAAHA